MIILLISYLTTLRSLKNKLINSSQISTKSFKKKKINKPNPCEKFLTSSMNIGISKTKNSRKSKNGPKVANRAVMM